MSINGLSVYKISFKKYLSSFSRIPDSDLDKIANLNIESTFDYEKDEYYYCYVITSKVEINKYKKILEKNYIDYTCLDISLKILKNEYDISYIKNYLDEQNYYIHDVFIEDLDNWILNNLDIDIILDTISLQGIDSLREVDKKFLQDNYNKI